LSRSPMLRNTVRGVAPFLYVTGVALVLIGIISAATFVEFNVGFWNDKPGLQPADLTTIRYNGDVVGAAATLVIGGLVFGLLALVLVRLERLRRPAIRDHLRHCAALYVILGTLLILLLATYENQAAHGVSLGYAVAVVAFFTVGYAIAVDALVLWRQRQRYVRASFGTSA
jgi:magnesium-transporting ATPase (P-type)